MVKCYSIEHAFDLVGPRICQVFRAWPPETLTGVRNQPSQGEEGYAHTSTWQILHKGTDHVRHSAESHRGCAQPNTRQILLQRIILHVCTGKHEQCSHKCCIIKILHTRRGDQRQARQIRGLQRLCGSGRSDKEKETSGNPGQEEFLA